MDKSRRPWNGATLLGDDRFLKGRLRYRAFLRRESDTDGLSVANAGICTEEGFCATFIRCFGVITLAVGGIRDLGLDVIPDSTPSPDHPCDHAVITGLPFKNINPVDAEYIATALVDKVLRIWERKA
jgi:hypothetical protein